ncbi:hypothetical protein AAVH_20247 [Aphelenchoides avenae]|nr:hypothetical protein AAVH_20247 [Aphelenchus avenae]
MSRESDNRTCILVGGLALMLLGIFFLRHCNASECTVAYWGVFGTLLAIGLTSFVYGCCRVINYEEAPTEVIMVQPNVACCSCTGVCQCNCHSNDCHAVFGANSKPVRLTTSAQQVQSVNARHISEPEIPPYTSVLNEFP